MVDVRDARPHPTSTDVCHFDEPYPKFPKVVEEGRAREGDEPSSRFEDLFTGHSERFNSECNRRVPAPNGA